MARIVRKDGNLIFTAQGPTANNQSADIGLTSSGTMTVLGCQPPFIGAKVAKWWFRRNTIGTGTGTQTVSLVVNGATTNKRISDFITFNTSKAVPSYDEAGGMNVPYEIAAADMGKDLNVTVTMGTTIDTDTTHAGTGINIGVLWTT